MTISVTSPIGNYLRERRKLRGLSQRDLVDALKQRGYEYAQPTLGSWERGRFMPPIDNPEFVRVLADILGISEVEILEAAGFDTTLFSDPPEEMPDWLIKMYTEATPDKRKMIERVFKSLLADEDETE